MYGYSIPNYARAYEREWQQYDHQLRLRRSLDFPGRFILERRTRYLEDHDFERDTDRQVQLKDHYRPVLVLTEDDLRFVSLHLRRTDIRARGGARLLDLRLQQEEEDEERRLSAQRQGVFDAIGGEAYDYLAWRERRRVAV